MISVKHQLLSECTHKQTEFRCSLLGPVLSHTFSINFGTLDFWISNLQSLKVPTIPCPNALPCPSSLRWEAQAACWLPAMAKRLCPRLQKWEFQHYHKWFAPSIARHSAHRNSDIFRHAPRTYIGCMHAAFDLAFTLKLSKICKLYTCRLLHKVQRAKLQPGLF